MWSVALEMLLQPAHGRPVPIPVFLQSSAMRIIFWASILSDLQIGSQGGLL